MWPAKRALCSNTAITLYVPMIEFSNASLAVTRRDYSGNGLDLTDNNTIPSGTTIPVPRGANTTRANSEYFSRVDTATLDMTGKYSEVVLVRMNSSSIRQVLGMKYDGTNGWFTSIEASNKLGLANAAGAVVTQATAVANTSSPMLCQVVYDQTNAIFKSGFTPSIAAETAAYVTDPTTDAGQDFWFGRISLTFTNSEFAMLVLWKNYALTSAEMNALIPAFYGSGNG